MADKETMPSHAKLLGGEKKGKKKKVHGFKTKKLKSGGHLIQHYDENDQPIAGEEHAVPDMAGLHAHMDEHMAEGAPEAAEPMAAPMPGGNA